MWAALKVQLTHRILTFLEEGRSSHLPRRFLEDEEVSTFQLTGPQMDQLSAPSRCQTTRVHTVGS